MQVAYILKVTQILCHAFHHFRISTNPHSSDIFLLQQIKGFKLDLMILSVFSNLNDSMKYLLTYMNKL